MIALETTVIVDGERPAWTVARKLVSHTSNTGSLHPSEYKYLVLFLDDDEAAWYPEARLEAHGQLDFDRFDG